MSALRQHLEMRLAAFGPNLPNDFLLKYGRDYPVGPDTYKGPRGEQHGCYMNATHLAIGDNRLTYAEGYIDVYGVPIQHAWCVDADGVVIDPTVTPNGISRTYYGVPFITEYVEKACKSNGVYGVLDYFYARKTVPKLYELGLEAGQAWLLSRPARRNRCKTRNRKAVA